MKKYTVMKHVNNTDIEVINTDNIMEAEYVKTILSDRGMNITIKVAL